LLRLWRNGPHGSWLASLQSTATQQVRHFADLEQLWSYLNAQTSTDNAQPGAQSDQPALFD
jgi:hypothetical protein